MSDTHSLPSLGGGPLASVYVFWGDDVGAMQAAVAAIREVVLGEGGIHAPMACFNHERFDAAYTASVFAVLAACSQVPVGASHRLVEVAQPEQWAAQLRSADVENRSSQDQAIQAFIDYMAAPQPSAVLLLTSTGIAGTSRLIRAAKQAQGVVEHKFSVGDDAQACVQIQAHARALASTISAAAAQAIVTAVGPARHDWEPALDRVIAYAEGTAIDVEHVLAVVADTREADVFALTDAVGRSDAPAALALLAKMFRASERDHGQAMRLSGLLLWQLRRLCIAKFAEHPGQALNAPPFVARKLQTQARQLANERLFAAYAGLAQLDRDLKGDSAVAYASPYLALQRWILSACGALPGVEAFR